MTRHHDFTGSVLSGRYHLEHQVGIGAFASVYFARDRKTYEREVAIKVLHPQHTRNPDYVDRFRQEIRVAAKVATRYREHLVQIVDQGLCEAHNPPLVYFVMEYIDGVSLRSLVSDMRSGTRVQRPLAWQRAVALAQQLCRAIAPLHAHGVVHRDIKPENCLIERRSDRECIKLLDLGIAKVIPHTLLSGDSPTTEARMVLGTPRYMAPEQMSGLDVDHRVDIYAVGIILYEFLTGVLPRRIDFSEAEAGLQPPEPRPPSHVAPEMNIPRALDAAVLQAIAWRREDRFARAEAFAAALEDASRTTPTRTRGITSRITQPFLLRTPTRRMPVSASFTIPHPPAEPAPVAVPPRGRRSHPGASPIFTSMLSGAGSLSAVVCALTMLVNVRTASTRPALYPVLEDLGSRDPGITAPRSASTPQPAIAPSAGTGAAAAPERPAGAAHDERKPAKSSESVKSSPRSTTARALVQRHESRLRKQCGTPGEKRVVEYVLRFAPGSQSARSAKILPPWNGDVFIEFSDCVADFLKKLDFAGASERPVELRGSLSL